MKFKDENGDTNRWLVGIMGGVGAFMVLLIIGFQAQVDRRQDEALQRVAELNAEIHKRQDETLRDVVSAVKDIAHTNESTAQTVAVLQAQQAVDRNQQQADMKHLR